MITKAFVTAGRAVFTIQNNRNEHYTFKVKASKPNSSNLYPPASFVYVKTSSDGYTYMGMLAADDTVRLTNKSKYKFDSPCVQVFNFALRLITNKQAVPHGYTIQHEGHCGRCGRELTDPTSIRTGFGPYCRGAL